MLLMVLQCWALMAQTGPNSPSTASNNAGIGANAWSNASNILSSNNAYATVGTRGISNYVVGTGFGFNITAPANILGFQVDVEKSTSAATNVALIDAWSMGLTKTISAGTNRCLIVTYAQENGVNSRDVTAMTYGGRSMTQVAEVNAGISGGFNARIEVWMLLESEIALASNTTIVPSYGAYTALEYCEAFSSAVFSNVDQLSPVFSQQTGGAQATTDPHQLGTAFNTLLGGMAINVVTCGNRNSSNPAPNSNTDSYATPAGYTEGNDYYFANTSAAPTTGATIQTVHKSIAAAGSEAPSCNFNGTVNRYAIIGFSLQRARELDVAVQLVKGGSIVGSNLASTVAWGTTDGYTNYGGPTNLWGQTWTVADVNAANFGAALSARVQSGTARVDHMRITVYSVYSLPIELLDFRAAQEGRTVRLDWVTASESENDHFIVQRSADGVAFEDLDHLPGAGNSQTTLFYSFVDEHPLSGTSYYRLQQVDIDGTSSNSPVVQVTMPRNDLVVYPNPSADGSFTVYDITLERDQVAVYSSDMRLIRTHVGAGTDPVVHLEDLPDGTYVLMVRTGDQVRTQRVMKASSAR